MELKHIAIIMDGNGRWAKQRGLSRTEGHKRGAEVVREITTHCAKIGIKYLTLYAFSTENWKRPKTEVDFLMRLLGKYLDSELETYLNNDIRFETIGDITKLSNSLQKRIQNLKEKTRECKKMTQVLAINYGSKDEIKRAFLRILQNNSPITEESIESTLDTNFMPPVDMLIRTGGEKRLSNFLLWQVAYAELFFTDTMFPDFSSIELDFMIQEFERRQRRFGGL